MNNWKKFTAACMGAAMVGTTVFGASATVFAADTVTQLHRKSWKLKWKSQPLQLPYESPDTGIRGSGRRIRERT